MAEKEDDCRTAVLDDVDTPREIVKIHTLDTLFEELGYCGRFQVIFVLLGYLPLLPAAWILMFMFFAKYNPGWTCQDPLPVNSTEVLDDFTNRSVSVFRDGRSEDRNVTSISSCDAMRLCENGTFNEGASTIVTEWALVCDDSWIFPTIHTINMAGLSVGAVLAGYFGDNVGRKVGIHANVILLIITNIIAIFSVSWQMYAGLRFFIGIGCGGILVLQYIYVSEFVSAKWRGLLGAFPIWTLCKFSFALFVFGVRDWKYVHIGTAGLSFLSILPAVWLPESLRLLTIQGQLKRGQKVVQKIADLNRKPLRDLSVLSAVAETERSNLKSRTRYSYRDVFHKSRLRITFLLGISHFVGNTGSVLIGFGLNALSGDFFINLLIFSIIPFPSRLLASAVTTKFGRKFTSCLFILLAAACSFIFVALHLFASKESQDRLSGVFAFGSYIMAQACKAALFVWGIELFPTGIRSLSLSYLNVFGRLGAISAPFMVSKESFPIFGSFLILGFLQLIQFAGLLILPETKDKPLQDTLTDKSDKRTNVMSAPDF